MPFLIDLSASSVSCHPLNLRIFPVPRTEDRKNLLDLSTKVVWNLVFSHRFVWSVFFVRTKHKSIIAHDRAVLILLFDPERAEQVAFDDDARRRRRLVDHQTIKGVAIIPERRGNKAPVVGIDCAYRQRAMIAECLGLRVVGKLGRGTPGRLDYNPYQPLRPCRQTKIIGHR